MIYEEYAAVGEVTNMKTYKGSPEDIAKLLEYRDEKEKKIETEEKISPDPSEFPTEFREG